MFPCFDQPDLKAVFKLKVKAPKSWTVVSTTLQTEMTIDGENKNTKVHTFPETKKISTYVFSLHAGPYQVWEDKYESIPLRLMVRKSLAKFVNPKDWFLYTKQGFSFFNPYFGIPYPFEKYDQIIVPEFNFGAMENVAAVTFSERFVPRSEMTRAQKENLSDVILHEMAHMWFGNLVTMKWWNGLWLNESFATYMASLAQAKNTEFQETWISFFEKMKQWAYEEDSFSTNHPIEAKVLNTEDAFTQFDGITYGKGASVLKQLVYFMGEETFQRGVQNYLKRYSYSNSTLLDFLKELEYTSGFPMKKWSKDWLETKGTNEVSLTYYCDNSNLLWKVIQSSPGSDNKLRDHKSSLGVYQFNHQTNSIQFTSIPIIYSGRATQAISPLPFCPDFVLFNDEDHDFVTWVWDEIPNQSLKFVLKNDESSFRRLILWVTLYKQISLGKATYDDFLILAKEIIPTEKDTKIKKWILSKLAGDSGYTYLTSRYWFPEEKRQADIQNLVNFLWVELSKSPPNSDDQKYLVSAIIEATYTQESIDKLYSLLEGKTIIPGFKMDQDMRWNAIVKISSLSTNRDKIQRLIDTEKKQDTSNRGINSSYAALASEPNEKIKSEWINILLSPKKSDLSSSTLRTVAYNLFPENQKQIQLKFLDSYLDALSNFNTFEDENYLDGFANALSPDFCMDETLLILKKFYSNHPKLPAPIRKTLLKRIDLETRCLVIRKKHKLIVK
jgi:aminopeptidase N